MEESLADFVRAQDPDRFLCALFAPVAQRPALFTLIAYNHELARAREAASTPMLALIRLQWWRDAVAEAASGAPPRRHEVAGPLHAAIVAGTLDPAALTAMADAREAETAEEGIPSREAFASYLRGSAGGLALAAGRLLGAPPALLPALQAAGEAYGAAGVLRSTARLAAEGRCLLPADALAEAGLDPTAVIASPGAEALGPVVAGLADAALRRARVARQALAGHLGPAIPAALPLVLARRDLARLARGAALPARRGFSDRLAVTLAGLRGRL
jgi:phytoene synthase